MSKYYSAEFVTDNVIYQLLQTLNRSRMTECQSTDEYSVDLNPAIYFFFRTFDEGLFFFGLSFSTPAGTLEGFISCGGSGVNTSRSFFSLACIPKLVKSAARI